MRSHHILATSFVALAAVACLDGSPAAAQPASCDHAIEQVATSGTMVWNAVVKTAAGILVSGPRWAGTRGAQLAIIRKGRLEPYPTEDWNSWRAGDDPTHKFVNINALHLDPGGLVWAVDTGAPTFGGDPLPGAAKLVVIDPRTRKVRRVIALPADIARTGSYIDDIRFNGDHAYLTDAGNPGIIVLDLGTGGARRVLDGHPSTVARADRPIILDGRVLHGPDGAPLRVQSDPLEVSPDGAFLYFGPLEGPWSRVPTRLLDDPDVPASDLAAAVAPFADFPPMGGSVMDPKGDIYFSDLATDAIRKRSIDGSITTIVADPRLHWVDAMFLSPDGRLFMPAAQIDRVPLFNAGRSRVRWPIALYALPLRKCAR